MTFPSLRNHLTQAFDTLALKDMHAVLSQPTLLSAVQDVIAHTHGRSPRLAATHGPGGAFAAQQVVHSLAGVDGLDARRSHYPEGHTRFASLLLSPADVDDWTRAAGGYANRRPNSIGVPTFTKPLRPSKPLVRKRRTDLLKGALSDAVVAIPTVEEVVTASYPDESIRRTYGQATLTLWLQARMEQGYTFKAAQTMLALYADRSMFTYLPAVEETLLSA